MATAVQMEKAPGPQKFGDGCGPVGLCQWPSVARPGKVFAMAKPDFSWMTPVLPFLQGVEVLREPTADIDDRTGAQRTTDGVPQWAMSVVVPRGPLADRRKVGVVADECPVVRKGERVIFPDLHAAAYEGSVYFRATDVRVASAKGASDD